MTVTNEHQLVLEPELHIRPVSEEARRRVREALPQLRALRAEILASRGGKLIDVDAAVREARAAHERGE